MMKKVFVVLQHDTENGSSTVSKVFASETLAENYVEEQRDIDNNEDIDMFEYEIVEDFLIED